MSDVLVLEADPKPATSARHKVLTVLAVLAAAVLAAVSGSSLGDGTKAAVVLPLAAGVGLCLAWLAASRFMIYVLIMLTLRSSIDLTKLSGPTAGVTVATAPSGTSPPLDDAM